MEELETLQILNTLKYLMFFLLIRKNTSIDTKMNKKLEIKRLKKNNKKNYLNIFIYQSKMGQQKESERI